MRMVTFGLLPTYNPFLNNFLLFSITIHVTIVVLDDNDHCPMFETASIPHGTTVREVCGMCVCVCVCVCACVRAWVGACMCACVRVRVSLYTCM